MDEARVRRLTLALVLLQLPIHLLFGLIQRLSQRAPHFTGFSRC